MCPTDLFDKNLNGFLVVITGANSGLGYQTSRQLAKQGAKIIMACRNADSGNKAAEQIRAKDADAEVEVRELDLADIDSVKKFASAFSEDYNVLNILINNAGVMNTPRGKTKDGFEMQIGVNHLGHFLLTDLLLPHLKNAPQSRILNLSSAFHDVAMGKKGRIDLDDLHFETRKYHGWTSYAQSKLANLMHAKSLSLHLKETNVTAVSIHPGWVSTNLMRHTAPGFVTKVLMRPLFAMLGEINSWKGAQSTLYAALADDVPENNGSYFAQSMRWGGKDHRNGGWPMNSPNDDANNNELAEGLYLLSRQLVGLT